MFLRLSNNQDKDTEDRLYSHTGHFTGGCLVVNSGCGRPAEISLHKFHQKISSDRIYTESLRGSQVHQKSV